MKREKFRLTASDGQTALKFAWNSALDEACNMARRRALEERTYYNRQPMTDVVGDQWNKISGVVHWIGDNGNKLDIAIKQDCSDE